MDPDVLSRQLCFCCRVRAPHCLADGSVCDTRPRGKAQRSPVGRPLSAKGSKAEAWSDCFSQLAVASRTRSRVLTGPSANTVGWSVPPGLSKQAPTLSIRQDWAIHRSPGTLRAYRDRLDGQIIPALGNLRVRELTTGVVDRHLRAVRDKHGASLAKLCRTVLSGMAGLATRHDALEHNPVRDAGRISPGKPKRVPRALNVAETRELRTWLSNDDKARERDLPDLVAMLLATGLRVDEALAVTWDAVDLSAGTVEVGAP